MSNIVELEPQLPKPQLNTREFKNHIVYNRLPVTLKINYAEILNETPRTSPRTADIILSCNILNDVPGMPLYELTSSGDIITNDSPIKDSSDVLTDNAKGLTVNLSFPVNRGIIPMGQQAIYVDNTMEFYDILNHILSKKDIIPVDNDKEIRLKINSMGKLLTGSIFSIKCVFSNGSPYLKLVDGGINGDNE